MTAGPAWVLFLMVVVSVLNMMDRQVLAILLVPIQEELGVSDFKMGLLTGASFAVLHAVATIPIALWADRGVRRSIIALGLAVWSGLTVLTGLVRGYAAMLVVRIGVGIGEATGTPPAHSLLSDYFPAERRPLVFGLLVMGGQLGSMVAYLGGGWLNEYLGWRAVFYIFGGIGLVFAPLIWATVREPERGRLDAGAVDTQPIPVRESLAYLWRVPTYRHLVLGSGLNATANYAFLTWAGAFVMRVHGMGTGEAGTILGLAYTLPNALGILIAGWLAGALATRDVRWMVRMPALACVVALPLAWGFLLLPLDPARIALVATALVNAMYLGPIYAAAQNVSAPHVRSLAAAVITMMNTILGLGIGPPVVGWVSDALAPQLGAESIRYALAALLVVHLWGAAHLWIAGRTLAADVQD